VYYDFSYSLLVFFVAKRLVENMMLLMLESDAAKTILARITEFAVEHISRMPDIEGEKEVVSIYAHAFVGKLCSVPYIATVMGILGVIVDRLNSFEIFAPQNFKAFRAVLRVINVIARAVFAF
jgi:hypothetical protein